MTMVSSYEILYILRRYGKYLGGIDYEKVIKILEEENKRDRTIERRLLDNLLNEDKELDSESLKLIEKLTCDKFAEKTMTNIERRRLEAKLEYLKQREQQLIDLVAELKIRQFPLTEVKKAIRQLSEVRRDIRSIKKALKLLERGS